MVAIFMDKPVSCTELLKSSHVNLKLTVSRDIRHYDEWKSKDGKKMIHVNSSLQDDALGCYFGNFQLKDN